MHFAMRMLDKMSCNFRQSAVAAQESVSGADMLSDQHELHREGGRLVCSSNFSVAVAARTWSVAGGYWLCRRTSQLWPWVQTGGSGLPDAPTAAALAKCVCVDRKHTQARLL